MKALKAILVAGLLWGVAGAASADLVDNGRVTSILLDFFGGDNFVVYFDSATAGDCASSGAGSVSFAPANFPNTDSYKRMYTLMMTALASDKLFNVIGTSTACNSGYAAVLYK